MLAAALRVELGVPMNVYAQIAMCIIGMSLYFNAGKIEARNGSADHSILWAALSLATSLLALWAGAGWLVWALAQVGLLVGITLARVALDARGR
jgi:hypothetical protein